MPPDEVDPEALLSALGVRDLTGLERVAGGEDTLLWRVTTPGGTHALRVMRPEQAPVARREAAAMRAAAAAGVTVPRVEAETLWRGRPAMLLSWCPGRTVMSVVRERPWLLWPLARALGAAQARLNRVAAPAELLAEGEDWLDWAGPVEEDLAEPDEKTRRTLLDNYVDAFTRADPDALVNLLRADVELEMPPIPTWFTGRDAVVGFLSSRVLRGAEQWRMVPTRANGQPAIVAYERAGDGRYEAHGVQVLSLIGDRVARITAFNDPSLVPTFGLAPALAP